MIKPFKLNATFLAYVVSESDDLRPGMLYVRVAQDNAKPVWARLAQGETAKDIQVIYFDSRDAALDDARAFARCRHICITDIELTPFSAESINYILNYLESKGKVKVA